MSGQKIRYDYVKRKFAKNSKMALGFDLASVVIFAGVLGVAARGAGKAPMAIGGFGLLSFLFAFYGLFLSIQAFSEEEMNHKLAKVTGGLSTFVIVIWFMVILIGLK